MIIKCVECGKEISSEAKSCPNCGYKEKQNINFNLKENKFWIFLSLALIASIIFFILLFKLSPERNVNDKVQDIAESAIIAMDLYLDGKINTDEYNDKMDTIEYNMQFYEKENELNGKEKDIQFIIQLNALNGSNLDSEIKSDRDKLSNIIK